MEKIGRAAVPILIMAIKDPDKDVRQSAAWALQYIGPDAVDAVPALTEALADTDKVVGQSAAWAEHVTDEEYGAAPAS